MTTYQLTLLRFKTKWQTTWLLRRYRVWATDGVR